MDGSWSEWRSFPDPKHFGILVAPLGPGGYELRVADQKVLYGSSKNVALRMTSLLPWPYGAGTRRNSDKREFVLVNISRVEYRTIACETTDQAKKLEKHMEEDLGPYLFST